MDYELAICTLKELENIRSVYNIMSLWHPDGVNHKITLNNKIVALINYDFLNERRIFEINCFEVLISKSGHGTKIIKKLQDQVDEMVLYDSNGSKLFWLKMGFIPQDDGTGTIEMYYKKQR